MVSQETLEYQIEEIRHIENQAGRLLRLVLAASSILIAVLVSTLQGPISLPRPDITVFEPLLENLLPGISSRMFARLGGILFVLAVLSVCTHLGYYLPMSAKKAIYPRTPPYPMAPPSDADDRIPVQDILEEKRSHLQSSLDHLTRGIYYACAVLLTYIFSAISPSPLLLTLSILLLFTIILGSAAERYSLSWILDLGYPRIGILVPIILCPFLALPLLQQSISGTLSNLVGFIYIFMLFWVVVYSSTLDKDERLQNFITTAVYLAIATFLYFSVGFLIAPFGTQPFSLVIAIPLSVMFSLMTIAAAIVLGGSLARIANYE